MALPELDALFRELFTRNHRLRYGISVTGAAPDGSTIDVEFRFLTGQSYCCAEPGCHLPWNCERLVRLAAERSIRLPEGVVVQWHCIVEDGARLQCLPDFGYPVESKAYEFDFASGGPPAIGAVSQATQERPPDFTGVWVVDEADGGRTETGYVGGVRSGPHRCWNANGVCVREGSNKKGLRDGTLITRKSDGTVLDVSEFSEGTGTYRIFNADGELTDEIPLRQGKPHGVATSWRRGKVAVIRHYIDGRCVAASCGT